jgi:hypothetical protein
LKLEWTGSPLGKTRPGEDHAPYRFDLSQRYLLSPCRRMRQMRQPGQIQRSEPAQRLLRQPAPEMKFFRAAKGADPRLEAAASIRVEAVR